ncbi:MAG TPA: glycosyltransferase family 2 protein [Candidatus Levybacteria bacterium]|nr:glycosyltransferase family 2 protein [Candidatus Levybacteria bacterium]
MKLSAVILTKNEEKNIVGCINSLSFCDEILLIDDESNDKTRDIANTIKGASIRVISHSLNGDFAAQRNFALTKAHNEWVLFVDADERVSEKLAQEITNIQVTDSQEPDGYYIQRKDILWGRELQFGETGEIKLLRLAKKDSGKWVGNVHETWQVKGEVKTLSHPLIHYPHQIVSEFLQEINQYSTMRAEELFAKKIKSNLFWIILYPKMKFLKNYIYLKGYKDGTSGFIHAVLMSFHSFLVRAKLYLLWKGIKNT